jgi:hypothetical protein
MQSDMAVEQAAEQLDVILATTTAIELMKFKTQVISAFKHLGLDTRKHFGV